MRFCLDMFYFTEVSDLRYSTGKSAQDGQISEREQEEKKTGGMSAVLREEP